jgi:hypothetical protein
VGIHRDGIFKAGIVRLEQCLPIYEEIYQSAYPAHPMTSLELEAKLVQPFWYLGAGTPRLWRLVPQTGMTGELKQTIAARPQIKTASALNRLVDYAELASEDYNFLRDPIVAEFLLYFLSGKHDLPGLLDLWDSIR